MRGDDVAIDHLEQTAARSRYAKSGRPERAIARSHEGGERIFRPQEALQEALQAALAREDVLRRQIDELIQQQQAMWDKLCAGREDAARCVASLSPREREIMGLVLAGHLSKNIAADLGVSQRTVENHRAAVMKKTRSKSLSDLVRLAIAAA